MDSVQSTESYKLRAHNMLKSLSRYFRFSLRTLLIVTTLLAIVLGMVVYRAERQRAAVAWVNAHHGHVSYATKSKMFRAPKWLIDALGEHYFFRPRQVQFDGLTAEEDVGLVARLTTLERVSITRSELTADHVKQFNQLPRLKELSLEIVKLEEGSLAELRQATALEKLTISCCRLNAGTTMAVFRVPTVKHLRFVQCEIDLSEVGDCSELQQLEELYIAEVVTPKSRDFSQLGSLPKLWQVIISADWTPATYAALARQPALTTIVLQDGTLDSATIDQLITTPHLNTLYVLCELSIEEVQRLKAMPAQQKLNVTSRRNNSPWFNHDKGEWENQPTGLVVEHPIE